MNLLLVAALCAAAAPPMDKTLPEATRAQLARAEAGARPSALFRKLEAENEDLPRAGGPLPEPDFVRYEPAPQPRLVFDLTSLNGASDRSVQLALARELARASMALPVVIVEADAAAWVAELTAAEQLAAGDKKFGAKWRERALVDYREVRAAQTAGVALPSLPGDELERLAYFSAVLALGPGPFYAAVGAAWSSREPGACSLAELRDLLTLHGARLAQAKPVGGDLSEVDEVRYPARVVDGARGLQAAGGLDLARQALFGADDDAKTLSRRLRAWLEYPPK